MDITVHTGFTKGEGGTTLLARSLTSTQGEQVSLLFQINARPAEAKTLEEESLIIVKNALLSTEGDTWHRLDGALKELNGLFKGLLVSDSVSDIHAILAIVDQEGALHVSHVGRGEAYLIRGGVTSQITEFTRGKPVPNFVHISSGQLEHGDTVIFSTQRLLRTLTPAQLSQLVLRGDHLLSELIVALDAEKEIASLATLVVEKLDGSAEPEKAAPVSRRQGRRKEMNTGKMLAAFGASASEGMHSLLKRSPLKSFSVSDSVRTVQEKITIFVSDLRHPERRRRAHLLLVACAVAAFLIIFLVVRLSTTSQRSKTKAELQDLVTQITQDIHTADNRRLAGDIDAANLILQRAEVQAKQVMDNEGGLFRVEALDLLDSIRSKREEINNILRVSPRVLVNISSKNPDVAAQGIIGVGDGEFAVFDSRNSYGVLLNNVYDPKKIADDDLIIDGTYFSRYKSQVYLTTGNSVVELSGNQLTTMKTEDPNGWVTGKDIESYLRYLYVLVPDKSRIEKYERLSNRYGVPVNYNVNGDLSGALDMAIDGSVFVLKKDGVIVRLLRGETKPFSIRFLPTDALKTATKIFKVTDGNIYFLDPANSRVIIATDGGANGESSYLRQYIIEGEQLGTLQDLYVDPDQSHLYLTDEKRVYAIDVLAK